MRSLALSKLGRHEEARALLEPLFERLEIDEETGCILGGIYKQIWQVTGADVYLIKSLETYRVTYAMTGASYAGINVAALALLSDDKEESEQVARQVLEDLGAQDENILTGWQRATLSREAYLLLRKLEDAARWYRKAVAKVWEHPENIAVMRRQARLLLPKIGQNRHHLDSCLPVPLVVAFSGHLTDAPGRAVPRFPEAKVEAVRRAIDGSLATHGGTVHAVCSPARGGDLLFLQEVLRRNGTATVLLPFPAPDFKKFSVGEGWARLASMAGLLP